MENAFISSQRAQVVCTPSVTIGSSAEIEETFLVGVIPLQSHSFQRLVLDAVYDALASLGETSSHAIYLFMEETFKIKKQDIPYAAEKFTEAIEEILGSGAKLVEIQIMKNIHQKIGRDFKYRPKKDLNLASYLAAVQAFVNMINRIEKLL